MAYPTVSSPYGLVPVGMLGGAPYSGANRFAQIASGYATAIFTGDVVKLNAGMLEKDTGTAAATPIGVFVGCTYTDPSTGSKTFRASYPGGIAASDIMAYVVDDPRVIFKAASVVATTITGMAATSIGKNTALVQNAGSTATGLSKVGVSSTPATTATLPLKIVDFVQETKLPAGTYQEVYVVFNPSLHQYNNALGVA